MIMRFHCSRQLPASLLFVSLLWLSVAAPLLAQSPGRVLLDSDVKTPAYEIVSIRPASPSERDVDWRPLPNGFEFKNLPLAPLIYKAYGITFG